MKLSNKFTKLIFATLASVAILLSLGACDCAGGCSGDDTTTATPPPDDGVKITSILFSDSMPVSFSAVRPYAASSKLSGKAADFVATIEAHTGAAIELSDDHTVSEPARFEVLIGDTNRPESKSAASGLKKNEYLIKVVGYKLVAVGGSEEALIEGLEVFLTTHVKGKLSVDLPLDFSMKGTQTEPAMNDGVMKGSDNLFVNTDNKFQTIKYMGASGCWVGNVMKELAPTQLSKCMNMLYSEDGIDLNSYRYNIGGGDPMSVRGAELKSTKLLETAPGSGKYSLANDKNAIDVLDMAVERGAEYITLFINSPPAYMTYSGYTAGNTDGSSNLRPEFYDAFVKYTVDIVELFLSEGYNVKYISPINEPSWTWGDPTRVWQEGCYYTIEEIFEIDIRVAEELRRREITDVKVSFPETAAWTTEHYTTTIVNRLKANPELVQYIDHFACHSYATSLEQKIAFKELWEKNGFGDIPLHQTEWCSEKTGIEGALELSRVIHEDFTVLECEAWEFWVSMMVDQYSLITANQKKYTVAPRMWAMGNYSKFITGATRVEVDGSLLTSNILASAYVNEEKGELYLIVTNDTKRAFKMNLAGYEGKNIEAWETSAKNSLERMGRVDSSFGYELPAESVTTFVINYK